MRQKGLIVSAREDAMYDRQFMRESDKYFSPEILYCQWCEEVLTEDEGKGDDKQYCRQCHKEWEEGK